MRAQHVRRFAGTASLWIVLTGWACTYDFDQFQAPNDAAKGGSSGRPGASGAAGAVGGAGAPSGATGALSGGGGANGGAAGDWGVGAGGDPEPTTGDAGSPSWGGVAGASIGGEAGTSQGEGGTRAGAPGSAGTTTGGANSSCERLSGTNWNGHCYFVLGARAPLSFSAARDACAREPGATLVSITSSAEQRMIEERIVRDSVGDFWIGLALADVSQAPSLLCRLEPSECPFSWQSGEPFQYANWATRGLLDSEPNYSGACVRLQASDARWADFDCPETLAALCELD